MLQYIIPGSPTHPTDLGSHCPEHSTKARRSTNNLLQLAGAGSLWNLPPLLGPTTKHPDPKVNRSKTPASRVEFLSACELNPTELRFKVKGSGLGSAYLWERAQGLKDVAALFGLWLWGYVWSFQRLREIQVGVEAAQGRAATEDFIAEALQQRVPRPHSLGRAPSTGKPWLHLPRLNKKSQERCWKEPHFLPQTANSQRRELQAKT